MREGLRLLAALVLLLCPMDRGESSVEGALQVEKGDEPLPASLGAPIRAKLGETSLRLTGAGGLQIVLWTVRELAKERPDAARPSLRDRVNFPDIVPGSLVAVLLTLQSWADYRGQRVPAGLYTLRYAIQPVMKDHLGVSAYRDFLLLVPARVDREPVPFVDQSGLMLLSREASATGHPAVLGLFPVPPGTKSGTTFLNPLGQPSVAIGVGVIAIGLALEGHGETEGQN